MSKSHCLCPKVNIEEKHLVWKLSIVLLHSQFEKNFWDFWTKFVSDIFLKGCHFCILPVHDKTFCGKTTFWKFSNVSSLSDFERKQSEICNEKSANLPKLHSTRPAEKVEKKIGKMYIILRFSYFQQENVERLEEKKCCIIAKTAIFLIRGNVQGESFCEELIQFQTIFWFLAWNVQTLNKKFYIKLSILHSMSLKKFWGEEFFLEKFILSTFSLFGHKTIGIPPPKSLQWRQNCILGNQGKDWGTF